MRTRPVRSFRASLVLVTLSLTSAAAAQEFRATITGRVTDPNSLVVPGATVTITNSETAKSPSAPPPLTGSTRFRFSDPASTPWRRSSPVSEKSVRRTYGWKSARRPP